MLLFVVFFFALAATITLVVEIIAEIYNKSTLLTNGFQLVSFIVIIAALWTWLFYLLH